MIRPPALKQGDTIGILSTARKIDPTELEPAIALLKEWGFKVQTAPNLFKEEHQFAGTDNERLEDLQGCIDDPEIKAILCARGGYGTIRILDGVNFSSLLKAPKWIAGYSDVTALHNQLSRLGIESLHSTMPINFSTNTTEAVESLRQALIGEALSYTVPTHPFNRIGIGRGKITGGNLSMVYSQAGSPTSLETSGNILFLEDLDEYLYHIDRMMYNLKRNGCFTKPAGVIIGGMSDMNDNTIPFGETAEEIIHRHMSEFEYPVCFGFPAGHLADNRTLIFGRNATLNVSEKEVKLTFDG